MEEAEIFLRLAFAGLAIALTLLTAAAWYRSKSMKLLLATAGFGALAAEGVMLALGVFSRDVESYNTIATIIGLNFLALVLLYLSVLKR